MNFFLFLLLSGGGFIQSALNIHLEDVASYLSLLPGVHPQSCPPNEMWQFCLANCSDCARRRSCPAVSECVSGCDCVPRYFRVEPGGPCVPVTQCPKPDCGETEVFRECGPVCERCGTLRCRLLSCDHRCYCKQGHFRDDQGACVPKEQCPKRSRCSHNEEWAERGPSDEYCLREEEEGPSSNTTIDEPGCYCKEGYRRNTFGSCVSSCASVQCFGLSVYHACVPKCNATCRSAIASCEEEADDGQCYPGCFCPKGHVMNDFNNCILQKDCSTDFPEVKIVHGSGIMMEESSETTPGSDSTTTTPPRPSDTDSSFEDVELTESVEQTTHATTTGGHQEDFANEDI